MQTSEDSSGANRETANRETAYAEVKVESPTESQTSNGTTTGKSESSGGSRRTRQRLITPELRDGSHMPRQGPEALDIIFRLGILTTEQAAQLVPTPVSKHRMGEILRALETGNPVKTRRKDRTKAKRQGQRVSNEYPALLNTVTHPFRYADGGSEVHWRNVYYLNAEGLAFVARRRNLYPSIAESLYRGVLEQARVDHALLRNEFYRRLAAEIPRSSPEGADDSSVRIEEMWAEKGMTPIKLDPVEGNERRYLNPDGMFEVAGLRDSTGRTYRRTVYVESDTGSEDMEWQVTGHADKYAEHFYNCAESRRSENSDLPSDDHELPVVLFVSPGPTRTRWVRNKLRANGLNTGSVFNATMNALKDDGVSLSGLYWFTNLSWLSECASAVGAAYWPLSAGKDSSLQKLIDL